MYLGYLPLLLFAGLIGFVTVSWLRGALRVGLEKKVSIFLIVSLVAFVLLSATMPMPFMMGYAYGPMMMHPAYWSFTLSCLSGVVAFVAGGFVAYLADRGREEK